MSDLSSNSMSREELIRNARANCMQQINNPGHYQSGMEAKPVASAEKAPFKRSTYIRLFLSCFLFLGILAVKQFHLSYQDYSFQTITQAIEDNTDFMKLQQMVSNTLEDEVIPVFNQIKSIGK